MLIGLCLGGGAVPARAWQATPFVLHSDYDTGDVYQGVRLRGALNLPPTRIDGLELVELSALGYDEDADVLYLLSDHGTLFRARLRLEDDVLTGIELLGASALRDARGGVLKGRSADAEGLTLFDARNGRRGDTRLLISFERKARVARYRPDGTLLEDLALPRGLDASRFASDNRGPEAIAKTVDGVFYLAPERPLRGAPADRLPVVAADGRQWWYMLANDNSALVALESLDADRVLALERDFERPLYRLVTRLRIASGLRREGSTLEMRDVASFDSRDGWRVDNFEGLTRVRDNLYLMVSDDNESLFQRTLLVLFELLPRADGQSPKHEPVQ